MLTKDELQAKLRADLERLTREQRQVEADKKLSSEGFNAELKRIASAIDATLDEIDTCQASLFDWEGRPTITLAEEP